MPVIRLLDDRNGEAWFTLISVGPIHRIPPVDEERYIVSGKHLETLREKGFPFEIVVQEPPRESRKRALARKRKK